MREIFTVLSCIFLLVALVAIGSCVFQTTGKPLYAWSAMIATGVTWLWGLLTALTGMSATWR